MTDAHNFGGARRNRPNVVPPVSDKGSGTPAPSSSAARIQELLEEAELALNHERTGPDALHDLDMEAYLGGKCDGLRAALIATGEIEAVKP